MLLAAVASIIDLKVELFDLSKMAATCIVRYRECRLIDVSLKYAL